MTPAHGRGGWCADRGPGGGQVDPANTALRVAGVQCADCKALPASATKLFDLLCKVLSCGIELAGLRRFVVRLFDGGDA